MSRRDLFYSCLAALVVLPVIAAYAGSTECPAYSTSCDSHATALRWALVTFGVVAGVLIAIGVVRAVRAWRYHRSFY